jgi:hypothetical protein
MSEPKPCLGHMTKGVLDNAIDLVDIWRDQPWRRDEFGRTELNEIEEAAKKLAGLQQYILIYMNRKRLKEIA